MVNKSLPENSFTLQGHRLEAPALSGGLYVVATPIGNLGDITLRALQTLAASDVIACEDTRTSHKLLDHYSIQTRLTPYHDHNGPQARPALLERLANGQAVALISDAGTPLIADPGYKLVVEARAAHHNVVSVPGPSAAIAALSIAGHPTDQFTFAGFLPAKEKARADAIAALAQLPGTLCLYEAPSRLGASLQALADGFGAERQASVCREITKRYETVRADGLGDLATHYCQQEAARGEIVIVIAPSQREALSAQAIDRALRTALKSERVKDAANLVAAAHGLSKRELYQRALELSRSDDD